MNKDLSKTLSDIGVNAKRASEVLNTASNEQKNSFFDFAIKAIQDDSHAILEANKIDIKQAEENNKDAAFIDRLALDKDRIEGMCKTLKEIKCFDDPIGKVLASWNSCLLYTSDAADD